jgi:LmbE family N-acetylglucosaminyl deacetylase
MGTVILSPHLDDAVLSCWHLLTQPGEVTVINVFAGVPRLSAPAWWDRYTGATDSAERVRERVEEDRRALALAGRTPVNLDLLDEQYRGGEQSLAPPTAQIAGLVEPDIHLYAPAAFAGHPDHLLVRAAALELRAEGYAVSLYADLPHATIDGWPRWVRRVPGHPAKDMAAAIWDRTLAATGIPSSAMVPEVHELDAEAYARKLSMVRTYETQVHALAALMDHPLLDRQTLGYEVSWTLPPVTTAKPARAGDRAATRR